MSGRPDSFMPVYIGDYLGDTSDLTTLEHGAYLLLLFHYWKKAQALPSDDVRLAQIARLRPDEWDTIKVTVRAFFTETVTVTAGVTVTVLTHSRVEKELERAERKYLSRKAASERANEAKAKKYGRHGNRHADRDGDRTGSQPHFPKGKGGAQKPRSPSGAASDAPPNPHPSWNGKQHALEKLIGKGDFGAYFANSQLETGPPAVITVPSRMLKSRIEDKFGAHLARIFDNVEILVSKDVNG